MHIHMHMHMHIHMHIQGEAAREGAGLHRAAHQVQEDRLCASCDHGGGAEDPDAQVPLVCPSATSH